MATYRATQPIFLSNEGRFVAAGEEFTTDEPKGSTWESLDPLDHDGNGRKGGSKPKPVAED